jgi:hypothetical protein
MARSIENRLAKLEQANAPTLEDLECEQRIRESEARVRVIDLRLAELIALRGSSTVAVATVEEPAEPHGLTDDERIALSVARIAKIDARLAELIAIRDAP